MKLICLGSGKNMTLINEWDTTGTTLAGVNNVWKGTDKWDYILHSGDYPFKKEIKKKRPDQKIVTVTGDMGYRQAYVKMSSCPQEPEELKWERARMYLGLPIYFSLTYWALYYLKPTHIAFLGFDMNYEKGPNGETAFYGVGYDMKKRGMPDPKYQFRTHDEYRDDPDIMGTLMKRLDMRRGDCKFYNLSDDPNTVLPWGKITIEEFKKAE